MTKPVRLQLSRRKGFDLQALSRATNGLPATRVTRPSIFGNPFSVLPNQPPGRQFGRALLFKDDTVDGGTIAVPTAEEAVECYRVFLKVPGPRAEAVRDALPRLRGHNLACFCKPAERWCHADVLIELANPSPLSTQEAGT